MRHAESSRPDIFHGFESDVDLSELGCRQAMAVAPILAARRPDVICSSAMLRARHTAEPIAVACRLPLLVEPDLHERKVGALTGTPSQPEFGIWPDTLARWIAGDTSYAPHGSESFDDIQRRVLPVWDRLIAGCKDKSIVIVCHGIVCRVLLLSLVPDYTIADWRKLGRIANVSISELVGSGRNWQAVRIAEAPEALQSRQTGE